MKRLVLFLILAAALLAPAVTQGQVRIKSLEYGIDISTRKVARIMGEITSETAYSFESEMLATRDLPGDRVILINSGGGVVEAGEDILKTIEEERAATGKRVVCAVRGQASSMAFNILTHCDVRLASRRATFLFHHIAILFLPPTDRVRYTPEELRRIAAEIEKDDEPYSKANREAMELSKKDYDMHAREETTWRAHSLFARGYLNGFLEGSTGENKR